MKRAVRLLPIWPWAKAVYGVAELSLAIVIGEATVQHADGTVWSIEDYPNVRMLWKRLGLAPYNGRAMSTWRMANKTIEKLSTKEWIELGYAPRRRAEIHECHKATWRGQTVTTGIYRQIYDARRAHAAQVHPDWTAGHLHEDALRIMSKALLKDLWRAWRVIVGLSAGYDKWAIAGEVSAIAAE